MYLHPAIWPAERGGSINIKDVSALLSKYGNANGGISADFPHHLCNGDIKDDDDNDDVLLSGWMLLDVFRSGRRKCIQIYKCWALNNLRKSFPVSNLQVDI